MNNSSLSTSSEKRRIIYKEKIGQGTYGEVWLVEWGRTRAAAKRIPKKFFERKYDQEIKVQRITEFMEECKVLQTLDHQNIVKMLTVLLPDDKSPVLIMELMHCDLQTYINESTSTPKVSPEKVLSIALGVAKGLEYLHKQPIIHRDLASKNILLTKDGQPKIADLGVSKILSANEDNLTPFKGTPLYAAPETYKNVKYNEAKYGVKADVLSFGVVLLEMIVGHEPRRSGDKGTEIERRKMDIDEIQDEILKKIVIECLQEKSTKRPNASKLVKELHRIRDEREVQRAQSTKLVSFKRLNEKPKSHNRLNNFKVLLLGNCEVGKTSLFELFRNPTYDITKTTTTLSMQSAKHYFEYNDKVVEMEIVDTAGEEKHFALTSSYYRDVDGACFSSI